MAKRQPTLFKPGSKTDPQTRRSIDSVREALEIFQGRRGNKLDRALTLRDLEGSGALSKGIREVLGDSIWDYLPDTDLGPVPQIKGFVLTYHPEYIWAKWAYPNTGVDNNYYATFIYRTQVFYDDETDKFYSDDTFTTEVQRPGLNKETMFIGTSTSNVFVDDEVVRDQWYIYWAHHVGSNGVEGALFSTEGELIRYIDPVQDKLEDIDVLIDSVSTDIESLEYLEYENYHQSIEAENLGLELLRSAAQGAAIRENIRERNEQNQELIDAAVYIDPNSGTIVNRAFQYTEDKFTQAQIQIDGVDARITAAVDEIEVIDGQLSDLSAELELIPGEITATAQAVVSEAISALTPAHSFNFFDSAQNWVAVDGTVGTAVPSEISLTYGNIENSNLSFVAEDNPVIRLNIERTAGTGWAGDVEIERDDSSTQLFSGIIEDVESGGEITRSIDFRGVSGWTGTVTRVRLKLGTSTNDEFTLSSIVIGKPDAVLLELEGVTARVTQAELDINANTGQIDLVSNNLQMFEDSVESEFTQVGVEIDSLEGSIQSRAFQIFWDGRRIEGTELERLFDEIDLAKYRKGDIDKRVIYADAINRLEVDVGPEGALARSITGLEAVVAGQGNSIVSNASLIQEVSNEVKGNVTAINQLLASVENNESGITAQAGLIQTAQTGINDNASAINQLLASVEDNESELSAQAGLIQDVQLDADNNASAINQLQSSVNDPVTGLSAVNTLIQDAQIDINDNASAITTLDSRVTDNEDFATAQLQLNSSYDSELDQLSARAALVTDINDRITGIIINDDGVDRVIEFVADSVNFVDGNGDLKIYYDLNEGLYVFDGKILASSGQFTGDIIGSDIQGGTISIGAGFYVDLGGNITQQGGYYRTAPSSFSSARVLVDGRVSGNSGYRFWTGVGPASDGNGNFFVRNNGDVVLKGDLSGSNGTFEGTIKAENIIGETVGAASLTLSGTFGGPVSSVKLIDVTIASSSVARDLIFPTFRYSIDAEGPYSHLINFNITRNGTTVYDVTTSIFNPFRNLSVYLAPNQTHTVRLFAERRAGADNFDALDQAYYIMTVKKSEEITIN